MDPDAVRRLICDELKTLQADPGNAEKRQNAVDALHILIHWLVNGGFPPNNITI